MNAITGTVIRAGTMEVDSEKLTGVFIEVPEEELKNSNANILYQKVNIVKTDGKEAE